MEQTISFTVTKEEWMWVACLLGRGTRANKFNTVWEICCKGFVCISTRIFFMSLQQLRQELCCILPYYRIFHTLSFKHCCYVHTFVNEFYTLCTKLPEYFIHCTYPFKCNRATGPSMHVVGSDYSPCVAAHEVVVWLPCETVYLCVLCCVRSVVLVELSGWKCQQRALLVEPMAPCEVRCLALLHKAN